MLISWPLLAPALLLLLVPIGPFFGATIRHRSIRSEWQGYGKRLFGLPHHTVDLLRAAGGAWLLAAAVTVDPAAAGAMRHAAPLLHTGLLLAAVALQSLLCREPDSVHAPFAFLLGLTVGFLPPVVAAAAVVLTLTLSTGSRTPVLFFPALAGSAVAAGLLFEGRPAQFQLAPVALAALIPLALSLLLSRDLVVAVLPRRGNDTQSPVR